MKKLDIFKNAANLWDYNNPLAEKIINGIKFIITDENKRVNNKKLYTLYGAGLKIGNFTSLKVAKNAASNINLILNLQR